MVLSAPQARVVQSVNWIAVHDDRTLAGFPDAGKSPAWLPNAALRADRLVRDVTARVRVRGRDVPAGAGSVELAFCPPGPLATDAPLGAPTPPTASARAPLPSGTFDVRTVEVTLTAAAWREHAGADPAGPILPATVRITVAYQGAAGEIEIQGLELGEPGPASPNLLPNGGFEDVDAPAIRGLGAAAEVPLLPAGRLLHLQHLAQRATPTNRGPVGADALVAARRAAQPAHDRAAGDETCVASRRDRSQPEGAAADRGARPG